MAMERITTDAPRTQADVKRYAYFWFAGLAAGNLALTLIAIAAIMNDVPGFAALVLCAQVIIPGLAMSKWLEVGSLWRGANFNGSDPETETRVAMPALLGLILAAALVWALYLTGLPS